MSFRRRIRLLVSLSGALALFILLASFSQPGKRANTLARAGVPASDRAQSVYSQAAALARARNCRGANDLLAPLAGAGGPDAPFSALLSGFYAHLCQEPAKAEELLFAAADPSSLLEDWRLFLLAETAAARGHSLLARAALARLLGDYPASPLRPRALLQAARLEQQNGEAQKALGLIAQARREGVRGETGREIEKLAWEIGARVGEAEVQREAARHLLVEHPAVAAELKVAEIFARGAAPAAVSWATFLSGEQLERRAESLLGLGLAPNALAALDAVAPAERRLRWYLLKAQALTLARNGGDALSLLVAQRATTPRDEAALEWARAAAMAELVRASKAAGRSARVLPAEPAELRSLYRQHLQRVVQIGAEPELSQKALRALYSELAGQDLYDLSVEALRQLRRLDPRDATGAAPLWDRGWQAFARADYPQAIRFWTDLRELYPDESAARRGFYWSARAYELSGEGERARQIYQEIAGADTTDFYRKNALERLGGKPEPAVQTRGGRVEAWPADPALGRARLLSDLGLEPLAWTEISLVTDKADPRARRALEALLLARQGERRKSIIPLRDAFPELGTPFQSNLPEEALKLYYPLDYQEPIRTWAEFNQLPLPLVLGVIRQESAFDRFATSHAGARGLMQLMPGTARELARRNGLGFSPEMMHDPSINVRLGTTYLRQVLGMFDSNVELALAGYNGGPYRIKRLWNEAGATDLDRFLEGLSIEESKTYVKRILLLSDSYRRLYPQIG